MRTTFAILLFFAAAYFIYIAVIDTYAPEHVRKTFGDMLGHSTSLIKWRFLIAGLLTAAGVWVLS